MSFYLVCYEFDNGDVCRSFRASVCMYTVAKAFFMCRATVIVRASVCMYTVAKAFFMCRATVIVRASVCMYTVAKAFFMCRATVIVRARGVIGLNPMSIALLMICSAVIVEWHFEAVLCLAWVIWKKSISRVLAINARSEMGLHEVLMFMSLLGFGVGIMFVNFHV